MNVLHTPEPEKGISKEPKKVLGQLMLQHICIFSFCFLGPQTHPLNYLSFLVRNYIFSAPQQVTSPVLQQSLSQEDLQHLDLSCCEQLCEFGAPFRKISIKESWCADKCLRRKEVSFMCLISKRIGRRGKQIPICSINSHILHVFHVMVMPRFFFSCFVGSQLCPAGTGNINNKCPH